MNLNESLGLLTTNNEVVGTPQIMFINPIMISHAHKTIEQPLMSSIIVKWYRNIGVEDPKGRHQEPFVTT